MVNKGLYAILLLLCCLFLSRCEESYFYRTVVCSNTTAQNKTKVCSCIIECVIVVFEDLSNSEGCETIGVCDCPDQMDGYSCSSYLTTYELFNCYGKLNWEDDETKATICGGNGRCIDDDTCSCDNRLFYPGNECEFFITNWANLIVENWQQVLIITGIIILSCFVCCATCVLLCFKKKKFKTIDKSSGEVFSERKEIKGLLENFILLKSCFDYYVIVKKKIMKKEVEEKMKKIVVDEKLIERISKLIEKERFSKEELNLDFKGKDVLEKEFKQFRKVGKLITRVESKFKKIENILFYQNVDKKLIYCFLENLLSDVFEIFFFENLEKVIFATTKSELELKEMSVKRMRGDNHYKELFTALYMILQELNKTSQENKTVAERFRDSYKPNLSNGIKLMYHYRDELKRKYQKSMRYGEYKEKLKIDFKFLEEMSSFRKKTGMEQKITDFLNFYNKNFKKKDPFKRPDIYFFEDDEKSDDEHLVMNEMINNSRRMVNTLRRQRIERCQLQAETLIGKICEYIKKNQDSDTFYYSQEYSKFLSKNFFFIDTPMKLVKSLRVVIEEILINNENNEEEVILPVLKCVHQTLCVAFYQQLTTDILMNSAEKDKFFDVIGEIKDKFKGNVFVELEIGYIEENLKLIKDVSSLLMEVIDSIRLFDWSKILTLLVRKYRQIAKKTSDINLSAWYKRYIAYYLRNEQSMLKLEILNVKANLDYYNNQPLKVFYLQNIGDRCIKLFGEHVAVRTLIRKIVANKQHLDKGYEKFREITGIPVLVPGRDIANLIEKQIIDVNKDLKRIKSFVDTPGTPGTPPKAVAAVAQSAVMTEEVIQIQPDFPLKRQDSMRMIKHSRKIKKKKKAPQDEFSHFYELFRCINQYKRGDLFNIKDDKDFLKFLRCLNIITLLEFRDFWNSLQNFVLKSEDMIIKLKGIEVTAEILKEVGQKKNSWEFISEMFLKKTFIPSVGGLFSQKINKYDLEEQIQKAILSANKFFTFEKYVRDIVCHIRFLELDIYLTEKNLCTYKDLTFPENKMKMNFEEFSNFIDTDDKILFTAVGGAGKSCLLRHLVYYLSQKREVYPLFIKADLFAEFAKDWKNDATLAKKINILVDSLVQTHFSELNTNFTHTEINELKFEFKEIVKNEKLCLIIDGFDEIPDIKRNSFMVFLEVLLKENEIQFKKFILSSRPLKEIEDEKCVMSKKRFHTFEIQPLEEEDTVKLIETLLIHNEFEQGKLLERFRQTTKQIGIEGNPLISVLILKRLLNTEEKDDDFIQSKYHLYESIMFSSINEDKKRKKFDDNSVANASTYWLMNTFSTIAYILHRTQIHKKSNLMNILNQKLEQFIDNERWLGSLRSPLESIIESLIAFSSLCQSQKNYILFSHRTIQEFFCSRFIINPEQNVNMKSLLNYFNETENLYFSFYFENDEEKTKDGKGDRSSSDIWGNVYEFCTLNFCHPFSSVENLLYYKDLCLYYLDKLKFPTKTPFFFHQIRLKQLFSGAFDEEIEIFQETRELARLGLKDLDGNAFPSLKKFEHFKKLWETPFEELKSSKQPNFEFDQEEYDEIISLRNLNKDRKLMNKLQRIKKLLICFEKFQKINLSMPRFFSIFNEIKRFKTDLLQLFEESSSIIKFVNFIIKELEFLNFVTITTSKRKKVIKLFCDFVYHEMKKEILLQFEYSFDGILTKMVSSASLNSKKDVLNLLLYHLCFSNYNIEKTREFFQKQKVEIRFQQKFCKKETLFKISGKYQILDFDPKTQVIEILNSDSYLKIADYKKITDSLKVPHFGKFVQEKNIKSELTWLATKPLRVGRVIKTFHLGGKLFLFLKGLVIIIEKGVKKEVKKDVGVKGVKEEVEKAEKDKEEIIVFTDMEVQGKHIYNINENTFLIIMSYRDTTFTPVLKEKDLTTRFGYLRFRNKKWEFVNCNLGYWNICGLRRPNDFLHFEDTLFMTEENYVFYFDVVKKLLVEQKLEVLWSLKKEDLHVHGQLIMKLYPLKGIDEHIVIKDVHDNYTFFNYKQKEVLYNVNLTRDKVLKNLEFFYVSDMKTIFIKYFVENELKTYFESYKIMEEADEIISTDTRTIFIEDKVFETGIRNKFIFFLHNDTLNFQYLKNSLLIAKSSKSYEAKEIFQSITKTDQTKVSTVSDMFGIIHSVRQKFQELPTKIHQYKSGTQYIFKYVENNKNMYIKHYNKDGTIKFVEGKVKRIDFNSKGENVLPPVSEPYKIGFYYWGYIFKYKGEQFLYDPDNYTVYYNGVGKKKMFVFTNGRIFQCLGEGEGEMYAKDSGRLLYKGEFLASEFTGKGVLNYDLEIEGKIVTKYIGTFKSGKYHGKGKLFYDTGKVQYEGEFNKGEYHKRGVYYDDQGDKISGNFYCGSYLKESKKSYFVDGEFKKVRYEFVNGYFGANGFWNGSFKEFYINGQLKMETDIENGIINCNNIKIFQDNGKVLYEGQMSNSRYVKGTLYQRNSDFRQYHGEFNSENKYHSLTEDALLYNHSGKIIYRGNFEKGFYTKNGIMTNSAGSQITYQGKFEFEELYQEKIEAIDLHYNYFITKEKGFVYSKQLRTGETRAGVIYMDKKPLRILSGEFMLFSPIVLKKGKIFHQDFHIDDITLQNNKIINEKNGMYVYCGEIDEKGNYHGNGILYHPDTEKKKYEGEFLSGSYHGKGSLYNVNNHRLHKGKFYRGNIMRDKKVYDSKKQLIFEFGQGKEEDGFWKGSGTEFYPEFGTKKYEGPFFKGMYLTTQNEVGILYYPNGLKRYKGGFAKNLVSEGHCYQGKGTIYWNNKKNTIRYDGELYQGCFHGKGVLYYQNEKIRYEGSFQKGKYYGMGTTYNNKGRQIFAGDFYRGYQGECDEVTKRCNEKNICTGLVHGYEIKVVQQAYTCVDCNTKWGWGEKYFYCKACITSCHSGHNIKDLGEISCFCVCGCYGRHRNAKVPCSLVPKQLPNAMFDVGYELAIDKCNARGICTCKITDNEYMYQPVFFCRTCCGEEGNYCFCGGCAKTCHVGHEIYTDPQRQSSTMFCDCPSFGICKIENKEYEDYISQYAISKDKSHVWKKDLGKDEDIVISNDGKTVTKKAGVAGWDTLYICEVKKKKATYKIRIDHNNPSDKSGLCVGFIGPDQLQKGYSIAKSVSSKYSSEWARYPSFGDVWELYIDKKKDTFEIGFGGVIKSCSLKPSSFGDKIYVAAYLYYVGNSVSFVESLKEE